jgi:hypothetical protein
MPSLRLRVPRVREQPAQVHGLGVVNADCVTVVALIGWRWNETREIAADRPSIFVIATYEGKNRLVYFSWHLDLDSNGHPTAEPSR